MLAAIGQPELVDTHHDPRLSRLFFNKVIRIYPAFREFYGMEETIERIVTDQPARLTREIEQLAIDKVGHA